MSNNSTLVLAAIAGYLIYTTKIQGNKQVDARKSSTDSLMAMAPGPQGKAIQIRPTGTVKYTRQGPNFNNHDQFFRSGSLYDFDGWGKPGFVDVIARNKNPVNKGTTIRYDNSNVAI